MHAAPRRHFVTANRTLSALVAIIAILATATASAADLAGTWTGDLAVGGNASLRLVLHLEASAAGGWTATLDSPDQGATGLAVERVSLDGDQFTLEMPDLGARFEGLYDAGAGTISGQWRQGGGRLPLTLTREAPGVGAAPPEIPAELEGNWEGRLPVPGRELRLVLGVATGDDGTRGATLDSPDQGGFGFVVSDLTLDGGTLSFRVRMIGASFTGERSEDGLAYAGTFSQHGVDLPLTLRRSDEATLGPVRPQEPRPPFPYEVEEVRYAGGAEGVELAGTLTLPRGDGPWPAVLLITGSGPQDRDETVFGHRPFLVLADHLTRAGIAVLRVDDRGIGASTGAFATATTADFAADAAAGVDFLRRHAHIDPARVGLVGHSEGGLVAPMVAAESSEVAFLVLIAAPGYPGAEILLQQTDAMQAAAGVSDEARAAQARLLREAYVILEREPDSERAGEELEATARRILAEVSADELAALGETVDQIAAQMRQLTMPWTRYFLAHDPRPTLARVGVPVLAVNGSKDLQVLPAENLAAVAAALREGGNEQVTVREFAGLNHLLQTADTGLPGEYGAIEETMAPAALAVIAEWILEVGAQGSP